MDMLTELRAIAGQSESVTYPSKASAGRVRAAICRLLALFDMAPPPGRNMAVAAASVVTMSDDAVKLSAKHDPDIFRDVARAYLAHTDTMRTQIDQIMTGGNHLGSALINKLGIHNTQFPPYDTEFDRAQDIIRSTVGTKEWVLWWDVWACWAMIMRARDALCLAAKP